MIRYLYIIEKQSFNNLEASIRKILATEKELELKGQKINKENNFGVRIKPCRTETITYIGKIECDSLKELKYEFNKVVKKENLNLEYTYNDKKYIIIRVGEKREGVWKDGNLIFHELRPNMIEKETIEVVSDIQKEEKEETSNDFTDYYGKWKKRLNKLTNIKSYQKALFISFILTINEYITREQISYPKTIIYHYQLLNDLKIITKGIPYYTLSQYKKYIEPTYRGKVNNLEAKNQFYSALSSEQIYSYYNFFVKDFLSRDTE